jgi:serine/threonine protein phosphatase PrpC
LKPEAPNQDSFVVVCFENELRIYGVFDGHGKQGHFVSNYVKEQLPKFVLAAENVMTDPESVLSAAFASMQAGLEQCAAREVFDCRRSGTTATIILHFVTDNRVVVAHVGDSRAVISSPNADDSKISVRELTEDHRPDLPAERKRIESGGGTVRFDGAFNHRVYARDARIHGPGLNMSRAFGDLVAHDHAGVSALPDVSTWTVGENDKYLIVSSDGIWEFITSQQACEIAHQAKGCMEAAVTLADLAWTKWRNFDPYTVDDITAVVIDLSIALQLAPKPSLAGPGPVDLVEEDIEPVNTVLVEKDAAVAPELGVVDAAEAAVPVKSANQTQATDQL